MRRKLYRTASDGVEVAYGATLSGMSMGRRSGNRRSTRGRDVPWVLLVILVLLVIFLEALLSGEWGLVLGMVISALGAGTYYLYLDGGRADRRLWLGATGLLVVGLVVLIATLVSS